MPISRIGREIMDLQVQLPPAVPVPLPVPLSAPATMPSPPTAAGVPVAASEFVRQPAQLPETRRTVFSFLTSLFGIGRKNEIRVEEVQDHAGRPAILSEGKIWTIVTGWNGIVIAYDSKIAPWNIKEAFEDGERMSGDVKKYWRFFKRTDAGLFILDPAEAKDRIRSFYSELAGKEAPLAADDVRLALQKVFSKPYASLEPYTRLGYDSREEKCRPALLHLRNDELRCVRTLDNWWLLKPAAREQVMGVLLMMPRQFFEVVQYISLKDRSEFDHRAVASYANYNNDPSSSNEGVVSYYYLNRCVFWLITKLSGFYDVTVHEGIGHGMFDRGSTIQYALWLIARYADGQSRFFKYGKSKIREGIACDASNMFLKDGVIDRHFVERNPSLALYFLALLSGPGGRIYSPDEIKNAALSL